MSVFDELGLPDPSKPGSSSVFADLGLPEPIAQPRSAIGEIANQAYAGAVSDLPKMAGQALQYSSDPGRPVYEAGKSLSDWATKQGERPDLQPNEGQHNIVTNALASGARMIPQSIVPAAIVGAGLSASPLALSGAGLLGASAVLGSLPAAMSQGQETLDKGLKAGISPDKAKEAARINALIEGGGETAGTYFGGKLFGLGAKAVGKAVGKGAEGGAGKALGEMTSPGVLKPWLKQIPETAAVEVGTEIGQNAGEAGVEKAYGIDTKSPYEAGKEAIAPTLGMTALLAPFGLAGFAGRAHGARNNAAILSDATADPKQREIVANDYFSQLKAVDPSAAQEFARNARVAISTNQPLALDNTVFNPAGPMSKSVDAGIQSGVVQQKQEEQTIAAAAAQAEQDQSYLKELKDSQKGQTNETTQNEQTTVQGSPAGLAGEVGGTGAVTTVPQSSAISVDAGGSEGGNAARSAPDVAPSQTIDQSPIVQPQAATQAVGAFPDIPTGAITTDGTQAQEAKQAEARQPAQPGTDAGSGVAPNISQAAPNITGAAPNITLTTPPQPTPNGETYLAKKQDSAPSKQPASALQAPSIDLSTRNDKQLAYLSTNGQPGYKEAAIAEIARRASGNVSTPTPATSSLQGPPASELNRKIKGLDKPVEKQAGISGKQGNPVVPTVSEGVGKTGKTGNPDLSDKQPDTPTAPEPRAYPKEIAERLATGLTKRQGLPSEAYPHPTEPGKYAIRTKSGEARPASAAAAGRESAKARDSESNQDRSWREYEENYAAVTGDIQAATDKNIVRAIGFASKAIVAYQKRAFAGDERAKNMIDSLNREIGGLEHELARRKPSVATPVKEKSVNDIIAADGKTRAAQGGQEGVNGYFYKGGQFLPSTMAEPGKWKVKGRWVRSGRMLIAPGEFANQPTPFSVPLFGLSGQGHFSLMDGNGKLYVNTGVRTNEGDPVTEDLEITPGVKGVLGKDRLTLKEIIDAWNDGQRWFDVRPDAEVQTSAADNNPAQTPATAGDSALLPSGQGKETGGSFPKPTLAERKAAVSRGSFDKERDKAVDASKAAGNTHLDQVAPDVETMRNLQIYYAHNPKQRGIVRTVDNRGNVVVYWADKYSAEKELASRDSEGNRAWLKSSRGLPYLKEVVDRETFVYSSTLSQSDLKDYVIGQPQVARPTLEERKAAALERRKAKEAGGISDDEKQKLLDKKQLYSDMMETKAANGEKIPEQWKVSLSEIDAKLRGDSVGEHVFSLVVEGHPMFDGFPILRNLVPIKVASFSEAERKLFYAQDLYSKIAGERAKAAHAKAIAKTAAQKRAAVAAMQRLDDNGATEDAVETLRSVTIPELQRITKEAEQKFGAGSGANDKAKESATKAAEARTIAARAPEVAALADKLKAAAAKAVGSRKAAIEARLARLEAAKQSASDAAKPAPAPQSATDDRNTIKKADAESAVAVKEKNPEHRPYVAPIVSEMIETGRKAMDDMRARVSDVRLAPVDGNFETITFKFDGQLHKGVLKGRNFDLVVSGNGSESDKSVALQVMIDGDSKQVEPNPTKSAIKQENPAETAQEAKPSEASKQDRGSVGASLTKEQRKAVLKTLVDVYKAKNAPKEFKGFDADGNERYGYAYSPDLFEKSDITGAMVRYHVTLPDSRVAHPTELFPDYTQSEIDAELSRQKYEEQRKKDDHSRRVAKFERIKSEDISEANRNFWKENPGGGKAENTILYTDGKFLARGWKEFKDQDLAALGDAWRVKFVDGKYSDEEVSKPTDEPGLLKIKESESSAAEVAKADKPEAAAPKTARQIVMDVARARPFDDVNEVRAEAEKQVQTQTGKPARSHADMGHTMMQDDLVQAVHDGQYQGMVDYARTLPVSISDDAISLGEASRAFEGTSMSPDRRGASAKRGLFRDLMSLWRRLEKAYNAAPEDRQATFVTAFNDITGRYAGMTRAYLAAHSRVMSTMITGPSNFPVASQRKKSDAADNRAREASEYLQKAPMRLMKVLRGRIDNSLNAQIAEAETKLKAREDAQAQMKAVNTAHGKFMKDPASLDKTDFSEALKKTIREYKPNYSWEPHPYAPYELSNNNAEIRRMRARVDELKRRAEQADESTEQEEAQAEDENLPVRMVRNAELGRLQLLFDGKPTEEVRSALKAAGFRWSPTNSAWQRQLTENAVYAANQIIDKHFLKTEDGIVGNVAGQATITPSDSAIYDMAAEGKSAQEILDFIGATSRRPFERYLARALKNLGVSSSVKLDSQGGWMFNRGGKKYAAAYNPRTDSVALFTPREATRHILHELVHAATLKAIAKGGRPALEMKRLFEHLKAEGSINGMYGMANIEEFVAEAFSNPKFQQALKAIAAPKGSRLQSAWDWFVGMVSRIMGIKSPAQVTALDRAMVLGAELMRENAALNSNVNSNVNRYAIAHHGTPHVFAPETGFPHGRFRLDKMGTGEGAQAYGWGVYLAQAKAVAERYSAKLSSELKYNGRRMARESGKNSRDSAAWALYLADGDKNVAKASGLANPDLIDALDPAKLQPGGNLYRLDIPDDVMPKLLDWDRPLSEQSEAVRKALRSSDIEFDNVPGGFDAKSLTGENLYMRLSGNQIAARKTSEYLASVGIPGLRYLDGNSRTDGTGTHNYVIWDQKTLDRIALLERNGEALDDLRFNQADDGNVSGNVSGNVDLDIGAVPAFADIRSPKENLHTVVSSLSESARVIGNRVVSVASLSGGTYGEVGDSARVDALARKLKAKGSYFERIIVDTSGNVIEGQHRLDALRAIGAKMVPVVVIQDMSQGLDYAAVKEAVASAQKMHPDQATRIASLVAEVHADENGNADEMRAYDAPEGYEAAWNAGIEAATSGQKRKAKAPGDTITIDGVERPRMNSNGKPIAQTDEALRKFWRFFGNSKVVDSNERPRVVFHGSKTKNDAIEAFELQKAGTNTDSGWMGKGFYFGDERSAEAYAGHYEFDPGHFPQGGVVYPVYLALKNPMMLIDSDRNDGPRTMVREELDIADNATSEEVREAIIAAGHDGVIYQRTFAERSYREYVAFHPEQIKSATSNQEFSPDNPDIRYNVAADEQWQSTESNLLDDVIYKMQNKQIDLRRTVQAIAKASGEIADKYNPELMETLYHGRAANETKKFLDFELRPLIRKMLALKVDTPSLETYLWARHAEERNAQIAKINPKLPDGGSGLTNAQAKQILSGQDVTINGETIKGVNQDQLTDLAELASMADSMLKKSRALLVSSGLETQAEIDAWENTYQNYVPLHREEFENDRVTGKGLGMSIKGPSGKRAIGSEKPVGNVLASIVSQREMYITRAEKNRVGNALYGLATQAPNKEFWQAIDPMKNASRDADQLWAKIKTHMTKLASMPDGDPELEAIIDAMKAQHKAMMKKAVPGLKKVMASLVALGLPAEMAEKVMAEPKELAIHPQTGMVVERVNPLLRHLDNVVSTRVNGRDLFVVFNEKGQRAYRMAIAMKNLDADNLGFLLGNMAKVTRYFSAINTQFNPIFGVTNLVRDLQTAMLNLSSTPLAGHKAEIAKRAFSAMRGIYADLRAHRAGKQPSSQWSAMFEKFKEYGGQTGYRDMFETLNDRSKDLQDELKKMSMGKGRRLVTLGQSNPVFAWLSDYNEMMENAVRVAAFSVGTEQGLSNEKAAALAKELTVNFNRKGQVSAQAGAMYAFFNAAVQGSARIAQTLFVNRNGKISLSAAGAKIVSGGIMLGVVQAILGALAGWDDEEPPQFVRERSLIIPFGDHYFSVPMPLGFNVLPNIGRISAEFAMSGFKDPTKRISSMLNVLADTLNPIGNAGVSLQTIAPTVIDPLAALAENKDWTGKPIKRMSFNDQAAGYKNAKDTATYWSKLIAQGLNYLSGGTEHKAGMMSPTPDQIDYLIGQITGGVGREISKASQVVGSAFTGEDLPLYKVPLAGKFIGSTTGQAAEASRFYSNMQELKGHKAEIDGRKKARQDVGEYLRDNPDARMVPLATRIERNVQELRRTKRLLIEKDAPKDQIKAVEARISALMKALNDRMETLQRAAE